MSNKKSWKSSKDPLFRGDREGGVRSATHGAPHSIVRHVLYLDGPGRDTPYLSCTEREDTAHLFSGKDGKIYHALPTTWSQFLVKHRARKELLNLLKGSGKGDAKWSDPFEVLTARKYVEEHQEHLCDFTALSNQAAIDTAIQHIFKKK